MLKRGISSRLCIPMNEYDRLITSVEEKFFKECYKGEGVLYTINNALLIVKCSSGDCASD